MTAERYLTEHRELHKQLNSGRCPDTIDEDYEAFWAKYRSFRCASDEVFAWQPGLAVSFHDAFIRGLTERRRTNAYRTRFQIDAFIYEDRQEVGRLPVFFDITVKAPLRDLNNKEVYSLILDEQRQEFGVAYHVPWRSMRLIVVPYLHFSHRFGEFVPYTCNKNHETQA